jgi:hypothetical protein
VGVLEKCFLKHAPRSIEAGAHSPNRDSKRVRSIGVRVVFNVDKDDSLAILLREVSQAAFEGGRNVKAIEEAFNTSPNRVPIQFRDTRYVPLRIVDRHDAGRALLISEKQIATDREQPSAAISSGAERCPVGTCTKNRFLREVVGVVGVPGQHPREPRNIWYPVKQLGPEFFLGLSVCSVG